MQPVSQRNHTSKPSQPGMSEIIVDARGIVLGRLASYVSKLLLEGKVVIVVNAEQAVITGRKRSIIERFKTRLGTRTLGSQKKAPKHPRRPDTYVRRVIRGMLPWKKPRGKKAYRRLKVHINIPDYNIVAFNIRYKGLNYRL